MRPSHTSRLHVSAAVIAEIWRKPAPAKAERLVSGATAVPLDLARSKRVGELLGMTGTTQLVDFAVATLAIELRPSLVLTSDLHHIEALVRARGFSCNLRRIAKSDVIVVSV